MYIISNLWVYKFGLGMTIAKLRRSSSDCRDFKIQNSRLSNPEFAGDVFMVCAALHNYIERAKILPPNESGSSCTDNIPISSRKTIRAFQSRGSRGHEGSSSQICGLQAES
jgi:hypothetical protein